MNSETTSEYWLCCFASSVCLPTEFTKTAYLFSYFTTTQGLGIKWLTSCGGTPSVMVLKSTFWYDSIHGSTKKIPITRGLFRPRKIETEFWMTQKKTNPEKLKNIEVNEYSEKRSKNSRDDGFFFIKVGSWVRHIIMMALKKYWSYLFTYLVP